MEPAYLDTKQAAAYLGLSTHLLVVWRKKGGGPRYLKVSPGRSGAVRYHRPDLDAWAGRLDERGVGTGVKRRAIPLPPRRPLGTMSPLIGHC